MNGSIRRFSYKEYIEILFFCLTTQMTNYQEELTQMQHDLETALETMAEVLANAGGDTTGMNKKLFLIQMAANRNIR